jgi:hypothetical protein
MTDEPHVARDISAEIEDAELEYAKQLVYDRADGKPVALISEYSAYSSPAGQSLSILFDWHENTTTRKARYSAEFERETVNEQWKLSEIGFTGEQVRAGQDQPIHFNGYLDRETLEQVTAYAAGMWTRCTTDPYAIAGVLTNRLPPIYCGTDSSGSGIADIVYQVSIRDLSPRRLPVQEPEPNSVTITSISSSDNTYTVRVTDVGSGRFLTTQADCVSGANCDPELLARLRADLDQPIDSKEVEKRLRDALAVLPARLRGAQTLNTQTLMLGTTEMFFVAFAEAPVSGARKETVSVTCFRPTGTRGEWSCRYSVDSILQRIPEQTREVHLLGSTFSESEVKQIIKELRRLLAVHPNIGATTGEIEFFSIHPNGESFDCSFLRGREFWKAVFTYADEVRLEALELLQRLPEGLGASGS